MRNDRVRPGDEPRLARSLAALGLAGGGIVTLASGAAVLATVARGTPAVLMGVFLVALAVTIVSLLVYVAEDLKRRTPPTL